MNQVLINLPDKLAVSMPVPMSPKRLVSFLADDSDLANFARYKCDELKWINDILGGVWHKNSIIDFSRKKLNDEQLKHFTAQFSLFALSMWSIKYSKYMPFAKESRQLVKLHSVINWIYKKNYIRNQNVTLKPNSIPQQEWTISYFFFLKKTILRISKLGFTYSELVFFLFYFRKKVQEKLHTDYLKYHIVGGERKEIGDYGQNRIAVKQPSSCVMVHLAN